MSSFIDLFEAGFFRQAGQVAGGIRRGISNAASAVGNAVSGAYHDVTGGYNDVVDPTANQPAAPAPAAAPQAPAPAPAAAAPAGGPTTDAINNFIVQKWGPKYQQLGQELASVKKEAEAFLALPPAAKLQAMGTPAAPAPAAPAPAPQVAAAPVQAPAPVAAPAPAKPTVGPSNWTPEQIAASQATLNTPQGQAYLQSQKDKANPWGAKSNQAVPATLQQPKASTYVDPNKTIRDAKVKKGLADIDAKYAKQRATKAQGNKAYADVQKELAGMTPAQKRERYKQWDGKKV